MSRNIAERMCVEVRFDGCNLPSCPVPLQRAPNVHSSRAQVDRQPFPGLLSSMLLPAGQTLPISGSHIPALARG